MIAAGFAALKRGDLDSARAQFDRACAVSQHAAAWFGLAGVHRALGQSAQAHAVLDRALELDPRHLPSLIAKGDLYLQMDDQRAANAFYAVALKLGAQVATLPPEWQSELHRIEASSKTITRAFETHLLSAMAAAGIGESGTGRFNHAVDLLLGKRAIFPQQPRYFYYPELPQIQFFDARAFPWTSSLERQTDAIRGEARAILADGAAFVPYVQREQGRPVFNPRGLLDNPDWGAFFLIKDGVTQEENAARCPRTFAAISAIPLCRVDKRTPSVLFSLLRPRARIPPHNGFTNVRLIGHLPLIVPPGCTLRVGNETRSWAEGEVMLFDDSIEHEATNPSSEPRVVLIFDVWRPELTLGEQGLVAAILNAVDSFGRTRQPWTE
jgi:aspartyl/asparaginyl beta-hydroxylase (cupin superfamily)